MDRLQRKPFSTALILAIVLARMATAETPAAADLAQEEAFLDVLPKIDVPEDVQPIPGAMNEEFRNCEAQWPMGYKGAQSGSEARALRDVYSFVRARNVIATADCSCTGKVANWDDVEAVAAALREGQKVERLTWQHTAAISNEARKLIAVAETMCGGSF
ncbi:hypothetical protein [Albidovulum sp.]|uniref:hypothetical protein n=1 Tax=Albidovulum sp. TaxID=1872424 RepID=UPI0039B91A76